MKKWKLVFQKFHFEGKLYSDKIENFVSIGIFIKKVSITSKMFVVSSKRVWVTSLTGIPIKISGLYEGLKSNYIIHKMLK